MDWGKVKSWSIGAAIAMILITHTPPVLLDPLKTALTQMRQSYASADPVTTEPTSISDVGAAVMKKLLR